MRPINDDGGMFIGASPRGADIVVNIGVFEGFAGCIWGELDGEDVMIPVAVGEGIGMETPLPDFFIRVVCYLHVVPEQR